MKMIENKMDEICEVLKILKRMRMLRKWGGIVDVKKDR